MNVSTFAPGLSPSPVPPVPPVAPADQLDCSVIHTDYSIAPAIIAGMSAVFGIMYTFFGYRFFKATMFVTGLVLGAALTYIVCEEEALLPMLGKVGVSAAAGVICGLIALLVAHVGLAMTGLLFGALLGAAAMLILQQVQPPHTKWIPIGTLFGAGLLMALLTLYFRKSLTMLATAMLGSAMMAGSVDYFVERSLVSGYVWDCVKAQETRSLCWFSWFILAIWPALFLVGSLIQCRITGREARSHQQPVVSGRRHQRANLQQIRNHSRREVQQNRYRHLYQIRRSNGDVISRSYIEDIQNKLSPTLRNITHMSSSEQSSRSQPSPPMTRLP